MEPEFDIATLESEATKEYLAKEAENIKRAEMSSRPPNWYNLQLNDPRIGQGFVVPEFNTEEGMKVRGILDEKGEATTFGEDYLMLEERGLLQDGRITQKGVAFTTPTEDLLPTSKMDAGTNLDFNDPENLEKFSLWQIREKAGLNKKPEDEGNAILNIFKGVNEMRKSIGVAISPPSYTEEQEETIRSGGIMDALGEIVSPKGGYTKEQRIAALAKAGEGAAETAVTSSGKLGTFLDKNVINPARKALGATDEQIEADNLAGKFLVDTRDALYEDVTAEKTWDAITSTTQAVEMRAKALEDYTRQLGPVEGAKKMAEVDRGAYATGGMVTDVPGMAVTAATFGAGKLFSLGKTMKAAEALKNASAANTNLTKLGTAATLIGKNIDEATASASVLQKQLDDALLVGNKEAADLAKSQLDEVTATIGESQARLGLVNDGIKLNEGVVQSASTKIDDLNAPSMVGRKLASGAVKKVADAADALGNGFLWTNRKLRAIERGIGMGRLPYLVHAAGIATLGTAYKAYGAIRVGSLVAAPLLKKSAAFSNIVGDEMLQLTNSSPFWRRVAANEDAGRMTKAFGGLMDYTTPITRGVVGAAKGTAQALPAMTLYEAINSQGLDENAMERAGAGAFVFGSFGRAIGSRNNWNQVKNNEFYNFRNKVKAANPEAFQQFEAVPYRDVKQFASSIDAAYPGMFDSWSFVEKGNSKFDPVNKQATINYNDRAGIVKAAAAHEALHGIQFKHQSDGAVASLMLGDETRKGLVRDTDGNLNPEFKQFWDEYNSRLDAQGLPKIDINDAAIEYFTDNGAQTLFEDVIGGSVYKASQKTPLSRSIESVFKSTMAATPIVKNLHFKLGGATDNLGRMVDGSGLLAKGMKELPEVKAMIRNMYRESAGLPKQAPKPQIIKDAPSQDPKHYKGGEIIRKANEEAVQGGTPLPDNVLNPDANGNGFGYLTDGAIKGLEESGVIADGDFAGVVAINSAMGTPSSYLLTNKPIEQGRSVQVEGITSNNIVPINWELKNGRLYLVGMDMVQLKLNIARAAKSGIAKKLDMKYADILNDIDSSALLHAKNQATDDYFQSKDPKNWEKRKNFINSVQGLLTESQKKINPLFDKRNLNKVSGIYRTFAWDRLGDKIQMTGEVAIPYGQNSYYSLRDNLMPQPPRMNRNGELVPEASKAKFMPSSGKVKASDLVVFGPAAEIPLGFSRMPVINSELRSMSNAEFYSHSEDVNSNLNKMEKKFDDDLSLENNVDFRRDLAEAQDKYSAVENEEFRRYMDNAEPEDMAYEFRQLNTNSNIDKVKMAILMDTAGRRGMSELMKPYLSKYASVSPNHAEVLAGKMQDAANLAQDIGMGLRSPKPKTRPAPERSEGGKGIANYGDEIKMPGTVPLSNQNSLRFLPEPKEKLSAFKGKRVQVLTSDLSLVGDVKYGDYTARFKGGPGYLDNDGWGFTDKSAADAFVTRWEKDGRPLIGLASLGNANHLNSLDARRAYGEKWKHLTESGELSKQESSSHIQEAMKRIAESNAKSIKPAWKAAAKKITDASTLAEYFDKIPWAAAPLFYEKLTAKTVGIPHESLVSKGLDLESAAKEYRQPEFENATLGDLYAIAEYDGSQPAYQPELNKAYPWTIKFKKKATLSEMHNVADLTTDPRAFAGLEVGGRLGAQPLMVTGINLDKLITGDIQGGTKPLVVQKETQKTKSDLAAKFGSGNPAAYRSYEQIQKDRELSKPKPKARGNASAIASALKLK